jgi:hypothetical protein
VSEQLVQDIQARGNFGYSIARALGRSGRGRAPFAIASFIAIPLFFSSLMASTLAQEKPRLVQWTSGGKLQTTYHDPTSATEARIWLWALLPPALLIVTGWIASRLPYGFYIACVAAIVDAMAVVHKTATWEAHHTHRFPNGVDLIAANNPASNQFDPGQWERMDDRPCPRVDVRRHRADGEAALLRPQARADVRGDRVRRHAEHHHAGNQRHLAAVRPPFEAVPIPGWVIFVRPVNLGADHPSEQENGHLPKGSDCGSEARSYSS